MINLLIKPASGQCNMKCEYCFYNDVMDNRETKSFGFMDIKTIENVIKKALMFSKRECTIAYQGGEPTLVGLDFFKKTIEFQNKYNVNRVKINNALQTNGYAITKEWAEFFHDNNFLVGLSLDGTKQTNDIFRHNKNQNGTFNKIMETAKLFDEYKVEYNILTVVNSQTAKKINSIYSFYKKNGFKYLQFIPCLNPFGKENEKKIYTLTDKAYGEFLNKLFDFWYADVMSGNEVHIRQFENYIEMILGYPPESCGMSGVCGYQNVVESDGSVYPCDFYVLDKWNLGNLNEVSFEEIYKKRQELKFIEESQTIDEKCKSCKYFMLCRGGCKRYREPYQNGQYKLNCFCKSYEMFFEHCKDRMINLANRIRLNNRLY